MKSKIRPPWVPAATRSDSGFAVDQAMHCGSCYQICDEAKDGARRLTLAWGKSLLTATADHSAEERDCDLKISTTMNYDAMDPTDLAGLCCPFDCVQAYRLAAPHDEPGPIRWVP